MKKSRFLSNLRPNSISKPVKGLLLVFVLAISSCQKEPVISEIQISPSNHLVSSRATVTDVVEYAQWLINFVTPLVKDEVVYNDIVAGNQNSALVTAKMVSLGFANFEAFSQEFAIRGSAVTSAINSGGLSAAAIEQILVQNIGLLDFTTIGGNPPSGISAVLPCYNQLLTDLAFVVIDIAAASYFGPWAAVGAAVYGISKAYLDFKNCLEGTYPNGG